MMTEHERREVAAIEEWIARIRKEQIYDPTGTDPFPDPKPAPFPWQGLAVVGLWILSALAFGALIAWAV